MRFKRFLSAPVLASIVLCCMAAERLSLPKPADASAYQRRVAAAAAAVPMKAHNWVGQDIPVPQAAVKMLSPNALLSRRYIDVARGIEAQLLLVQCGDARDMTAHYPPVCLVNSGWQLDWSQPRDVKIGYVTLTGTDYEFSIRSFDRMSSIRVFDVMVLPDGRTARDMEAVVSAAADVRHRYFGAAQVQVVTAADMPADQRDDALMSLLGAAKGTLDAILQGVDQP